MRNWPEPWARAGILPAWSKRRKKAALRTSREPLAHCLICCWKKKLEALIFQGWTTGKICTIRLKRTQKSAPALMRMAMPVGLNVFPQEGGEVKGTLPKQLVAGNYFAEQREFNLRLQANNVNFDQYLKVRNQTVEQFRAELHAGHHELRRRQPDVGVELMGERRRRLSPNPLRPRRTLVGRARL